MTRESLTGVTTLGFIPVSLPTQHLQWARPGFQAMGGCVCGKEGGLTGDPTETKQPQGAKGTVDSGFRALCTLGKAISGLR